MASKSELPLYVESPGWFRRRRLFVALGGASVIYCLCFFAFTLHDLRLTEQVLTQGSVDRESNVACDDGGEKASGFGKLVGETASRWRGEQ